MWIAIKDNETILVSQATAKGYAECKSGGAFDISYPSSDTRRGRVQGDSSICPAICAAQNALMVFEGVFDE